MSGANFPPFSVKKNISVAFLGFCAPAGNVFGGLIGAAFAEKVTWGWGFWFWAIGCLVLDITTYVIQARLLSCDDVTGGFSRTAST